MIFESRGTPRQRHYVASWSLVLFWPLFRYSDWRDAWILRGIGERYGPVLLKDEPEAGLEEWSQTKPSSLLPPVANAQVSRLDRGSRVLRVGGSALAPMLAAAVILGAAALGFILARSAGDGPAPSATAGHASSGLLRVSFPSSWRRETPPVASRLGLSDEIVLAPSPASRETLVIGLTATPNPQLLPQSLLASLPSVPTPQTIHLGNATFYRYLNQYPRGQHSSESIYSMSTTAGTVLGVCSAPKSRTSFISSCERSLATLELASGKTLPPGPIPAYATTLNLAISRLNAVRTDVGSRLRAATAAVAQATAAYALAAAHAQAATSLSQSSAGPASRANSAVVAALKLNDAAYRALGNAVSLHSFTRYSAARASVRLATSALTAAYSRLDAFGYSVS